MGEPPSAAILKMASKMATDNIDNAFNSETMPFRPQVSMHYHGGTTVLECHRKNRNRK